MSSLLPAGLRSRLRRSRLVARSATSLTGIGERPSRAKGSGMIFADYRMYQQGDDVRHIDRHVHARLGQHVVREFEREQRLPVTLLVDASSSMGLGRPSKLHLAMQMAAALAFVTLVGGDEVVVGVFADGETDWTSRLSGSRALPELLSWLGGRQAAGETAFDQVARDSTARLPRGGMVIVVSDWMSEVVEEALATWATKELDLVAIQVFAQEEEDPPDWPSGLTRVRDVETGRWIDLSLDEEDRLSYREAFAAWSSGVKRTVIGRRGRWFRARSDQDMGGPIVQDWYRGGLIR